METEIKRRRRRLLHAFGVSALTIAHKAYNRAEEVHGPIGFLAHRVASLAEPIVCSMVSQWLAILSFADDRILAAEDMVEIIFPLSAHVFDMIDSFVHIPDALPGKFDRAVDLIIRRIPFLQWTINVLIWELNFLLSVFTYWGPDDAEKEKEIMIDINVPQDGPIETTKHVMNHDDQFTPKSASIHNSPVVDYEDEVSINKPFHSRTASVPVAEYEDEVIFNPSSMDKSPPPPPVGERMTLPTETESKQTGTEIETVKPVNITYKEVLEMANNGDAENKEGSFGQEELQKPMINVSQGEKEKDKPTGVEMGTDDPIETSNDFPILELFDAGWHMETHRKRR
ncbi:hypothetical protein NE237_005804 [Protea cynaroides]|uniref:Uncharacterized protein n=1 Tax=Protea cynaroides TaxID=273540 RepID=A0A9Q0QUU9_9MAGN|nr:hypothetical protein NE237_005804 [Protea cynaroides]